MYSFVLKRSDLRENDQMVTLYTLEKGKVDALARGVKKILSKNSAYLLPVFLIDAEVLAGKEVNHLTKALPMFVYKNILEDLNKMSLMQTVFKWVNILTKYESDPKIFLLIKSWMEFLDQTTQISAGLAYGFLGNILIALGFGPELDSCIFCQTKDNLTSFYPSAGGVVCRNCFLLKKQAGSQIYPLRAIDLQAMRLLFGNNWDKILEQNTEIANRLVFLYGQYHSERRLPKYKVV
ncbi:MAG: DNA repair protein RecO [Candidatus Magasanikbacteria bacterium]|nr:DNA repair protein RecO [Candidatus Magasanikbacteria bacterium]